MYSGTVHRGAWVWLWPPRANSNPDSVLIESGECSEQHGGQVLLLDFQGLETAQKKWTLKKKKDPLESYVLHFFLFVCICTCVLHMHLLGLGRPEGPTGILCHSTLFISWERLSHWSWRLPFSWAVWLSRILPCHLTWSCKCICACDTHPAPALKLQARTPTPLFYVGAGDSKLDPQAWVEGLFTD